MNTSDNVDANLANFLLEDEYNSGWTTGIENISNAKYGSNDTMFSITGQLVDSSYRGIVIKNGKKYIVK